MFSLFMFSSFSFSSEATVSISRQRYSATLLFHLFCIYLLKSVTVETLLKAASFLSHPDHRYETGKTRHESILSGFPAPVPSLDKSNCCDVLLGNEGEAPRHHTPAGWAGNALVYPRTSWKKWLMRGRSVLLCLGCCPPDPAPDKRKKMDGWI